MKERGGTEQLRKLERDEMARIGELAARKGLRPLSYNYLGVWVPEDQETGIFPNHFFTNRYNEEDEIVFDEHRIDFPIKDPSQLSASLGVLNGLYSRVEGAVVYGSNNPTEFVEFVGNLSQGKPIH